MASSRSPAREHARAARRSNAARSSSGRRSSRSRRSSRGGSPIRRSTRSARGRRSTEKPDALAARRCSRCIRSFPPKSDAKHAGHFGTIYFGLLPTGTGETDTKGRRASTTRQFYEVTCFASGISFRTTAGARATVRTALLEPADRCRISSRRTSMSSARASGRSRCRLPDIDALAAQATPTLGVAFAKPAKSLMVTGDSDRQAWGTRGPIRRFRDLQLLDSADHDRRDRSCSSCSCRS